MTVLGVYILRIKKPKLERPYKTWGYPVTPAIFLIVALWMMVFIIKDKPIIALFSFVTIALGAIIYFINKKFTK